MKDQKKKTNLKAEEIVSKFKNGKRIVYHTKDGSNKEKKPEDLPVFLVLKNNTTDIGVRPLENPCYHPPCIWTEEFEASGEGAVVNELHEGREYQVVAEVHNLGILATYATFVEFYMVDTTPSTPFLERLHPIGNPKIITINPGVNTIARSDRWIPDYIHNGHSCLIVRAGDPIMDPRDPGQYSQVNDRHVGQRNVNIIRAAQGTNAFLMLNVWSAGKKEEKNSLTVHQMNHCELTDYLVRNKIEGKTSKNPPAYFGLITKESLGYLQWNIEDYKEDERKLAFDKKLSDRVDLIKPLPPKIDSRFSRALLPKIEMKVSQKTKIVWSVIGISHNANVGDVFSFTITQWKNLEIVGKVHHIAIVSSV